MYFFNTLELLGKGSETVGLNCTPSLAHSLTHSLTPSEAIFFLKYHHLSLRTTVKL